MNNYDKILSSCKGNNKDNRVAESVTDGNFIIATNGQVLCKIPVKLAEITYKANPLRFESWDSITKLLPNCSKKIGIDEVRDILDKCPKIERKYKQNLKCEECDASGVVDYIYKTSKGLTFTEENDCPVCNGRGYLIIENALQETVIDEEALIKVGGLYYCMGNLKKILQASVLLEQPLELVYQNKQNIEGSKFKVGEVEFLVMPFAYEKGVSRSTFYEV